MMISEATHLCELIVGQAAIAVQIKLVEEAFHSLLTDATL
jgi:hypothetical protein